MKHSNYLVGVVLLCIANAVTATQFARTGDIKRVLTDNEKYGGCMIQLTTVIANGCPANGWVSLDCKNVFSENGKEKYATALTAFALKRPVSVYVENTKKADGYCTAVRLDIR